MSRAIDARVRVLRDLVAVANSRSGARVRAAMDVASTYEAIHALRAAIADDAAALAACGMLVLSFAVVDLLDSDDDEPEAQA